jgi:protein-L-isoaspartate O-methyltransferase
VTQVGTLHADHATPADHPAGAPTSSSTLPGLIVGLAQRAYLADGSDVLDVGTGSGYGCALLAARLGAGHVTSVDVDPYLSAMAMERLDSVGLRPEVLNVDATGALPGTYDRIVATVAVRPVPASWLAALRPGGRLVTTIAGTGLILTADKTDDGGALGQIEWDRAGFMLSRHGPGYPPPLWERNEAARDGDGEHVTRGWYPVLNVMEAWELWSMITVLVPGVEHYYREEDGRRTAWMLHPDGSWARASAEGSDPPVVHQSGARRLWDLLDEVREMWLREGSLPVYGASATISPNGSIHLRRGKWCATLSQETTD